jgi:poly-beta-1,6-N-acetyl-D-glucosamine synthase
MTAVSASLFLAAVALAAWSYLGYPAWIRRRAVRASGPPERPAASLPAIEVLLSAADEEAVIAERVRDLLAQDYSGELRVRIGCDGCRDATAQRAREAASADPRVEVAELTPRQGKAAVLNRLLAGSRSELVVFTDANTRFDRDALLRLAAPFADPRVGAACGRLVLETAEGGESAETVFWDRESSVKEAEGRLGVCLGANGAIYAARRALVEPLPAGEILDDLWIPARIASRGADVVFAREAVARERAPSGTREELARRFRIGVGAGRFLRRELWIWRTRRPLLTLAFASRKAARWLAPVLALAAALTGLGSPSLRPLAIGVLALGALSALAGLRVPGGASRLYYFGVINLALSVGVLAGLSGYRLSAWKREPRG